MKYDNSIFQFGRFDRKDILHAVGGLLAGYVTFCVLAVSIPLLQSSGIFTGDPALATFWISDILLFTGSFIWEYNQSRIAAAVRIDWKDILMSCSLWTLICLYMEFRP